MLPTSTREEKVGFEIQEIKAQAGVRTLVFLFSYLILFFFFLVSGLILYVSIGGYTGNLCGEIEDRNTFETQL